MRRYLLVCVLFGCGGEPQNSGEVCEATAQVEQACSDGADEDCDGFTDCLDNECDGQRCGAGDGYTCLAGACLRPGALPPLPRIDNLRVTMHGDTAIIDFEGVAGAKDYRVYTLPADEDVLVGEQGEVAIRNAIYRCAGERPRHDRELDALMRFDSSLAGNVWNYTRTEAESTLGYVYLTPAADRVPVYRVANPNLRGGYVWEYAAPPAKEYNGADYVTTTEARDALVAQGWRDDGIAFYIPVAGTVGIHRRTYTEGGVVLFYADGPEQQARANDSGTGGERFKVLATQEPGSVPLRRVFYGWANDHDTLAAGEAQFQSVLHQGGQPVTSVTWPGLTGDTTLVIEALDGGCPFAGAYIGASAAPESTRFAYTLPTITVDQARLSSGEVFINGQADVTSRPRPIARGFVNVTPEPHPDMDWFQSFDPMATWEPMQEIIHDNNGNVVLRNSVMSAEFGSTVDDAFSYGPMLGQFYVGSTTSVRLVARGVNATLENDSYLHVTMATSLPSTNRRYPQIWITTTPEVTPDQVAHSYDVPLETRLGPFPFEGRTGENDTIVVQPFTANHEMQIQVCNNRGWGVSQQCDRANIYGFHAGHDQMQPWAQGVAWTPMPVLGELAGVDRPVKIDVYASTSRVYVFVEGKPAGCAVIPSGQLQAGPRNVVFGTSGYHIDIDESVVPESSPHAYWRRYHLNHIERLFDNLGISRNQSRPAWDEARMPCGTHWYGGTTE